jgi:tetratricopeptide (TPR) repeat protein
MKLNTPLLSPAFLLGYILLCCGGCSTVSPENVPLEQHLIQEELIGTSTPEHPDSSCSYFYFLWGTHAENNKRYVEAEEAFEKALICDPDSRYILRRLPILLIRMGKHHGAAKWLRTAIEKYPDDLQDRLLLARLDIRNNEIEEALALYNELIAMAPEDETLFLRLGFLYSEQNQYKEAEQTFLKALELNPESLFAHLYLARLATQTGNLNQAEKYYQKTLTLNWSTELAFEVAGFYEAQKNYTMVELQYLTVLKKHPKDTRAGLGLVHTLLLQDKEKEALDVLRDLRQNSDDPAQIDIITARLYLRSKKLNEAAEILEPLTVEEDVPEAAYMLAVIRYQQKQLDKSMALLRTIEPESSQFEDSIYLQVRILMERQQDTQAIKLIKETLNNQDIASPGLYTLLASLYMEQKQIQKGYDLLDAALVKYPDNAQIYFEYGLLLEQDGSQQQAIVLMEKVLELESDHAEALNYLGYTWADNNINLEKALEYVQKSILLKPDNGYILDSLGWIYFRMGKLDLAIKEILKALELEPEDPNIHEHLGDIYQEQGQQTKAIQAYKNAEEFFQKATDKTRLLKKINAVQ